MRSRIAAQPVYGSCSAGVETRTPGDYLACGCTMNERRLAERRLGEAREPLDLLARTSGVAREDTTAMIPTEGALVGLNSAT